MTIIRDDRRTPFTHHLLLEFQFFLELLLAALFLLHLLEAALALLFLQPFPMLDGQDVADGVPGRGGAGVVAREVRLPSQRLLLPVPYTEDALAQHPLELKGRR